MENHTYLRDGHAERASEFLKQHDHYGPGDGLNDNGTLRGFFNGNGA
ncbi:MAG TPA: hypothetical protein VFZ48_00695 [Candidatus Saccharimonadales bacterium]